LSVGVGGANDAFGGWAVPAAGVGVGAPRLNIGGLAPALAAGAAPAPVDGVNEIAGGFAGSAGGLLSEIAGTGFAAASLFSFSNRSFKSFSFCLA
jgi:hypothetical protein